MNEPGEAERKHRIISISLKTEDDAKLTELKRRLEAKYGERLAVSEIARRAFDCLAISEGFAK